MKKQRIPTVSKRCFKLWSEIVRKRAGNKCEFCGRKDIKLDSHHIVSRKFAPLRFDLDNGIALCSLHHKFSSNLSFHGNPLFMLHWFKTQYPERYDYLFSKTNEKAEKYSLQNLLDIEISLKQSV
jgi:hypothetical protein